MKLEVRQIIGMKLKKMRLERNLTLREVGEALKLATVTIHKYESGKLPISKKRIKELAIFYNTTIDYLTLELESSKKTSEREMLDNILKEIKQFGAKDILALYRMIQAIKKRKNKRKAIIS